MDENRTYSGMSEAGGNTDPPMREAGAQPRYCMRCGKRYATHLTFSSLGRKQYRCDACFEGKKKS